TNIRFDWDQDKIKQHSITFVAPAAHKTQVMAATNVAIVAAQNDVPTVLIDADLHVKSLHKCFGIQEQQGLSELLSADETTPQSVSRSLSQTFLPILSLPTAGSTSYHPVEIACLLPGALPNVSRGLAAYRDISVTRQRWFLLCRPPMSYGVDASLISS